MNILKCFNSGLIVPLVYQAHLTGIFIITDKVSSGEFKLEDIEFLSVLSSQISVAIENTRLYEAEKMASRQLREAQEQLVYNERQAALGEMSAKIAHEINNPLGIIKNYLQLIKRSIGSNIEATNYSDIVSQEINRIARIVHELLDFHRPQGIVFEKIDVSKVLDDVLLLMERKLEVQKITLCKKFDSNLPHVNASAENLKQVFLNLIINASDEMHDGGTISLTIQERSGCLLIDFHDTGPGIEPELIPHIFEPFFTTKDPGKGTGLGLSVCYGIIKNHGGSITYSNTETGGCFSIELPIERKLDKHESEH